MDTYVHGYIHTYCFQIWNTKNSQVFDLVSILLPSFASKAHTVHQAVAVVRRCTLTASSGNKPSALRITATCVTGRPARMNVTARSQDAGSSLWYCEWDCQTEGRTDASDPVSVWERVCECVRAGFTVGSPLLECEVAETWGWLELLQTAAPLCSHPEGHCSISGRPSHYTSVPPPLLSLYLFMGGFSSSFSFPIDCFLVVCLPSIHGLFSVSAFFPWQESGSRRPKPHKVEMLNNHTDGTTKKKKKGEKWSIKWQAGGTGWILPSGGEFAVIQHPVEFEVHGRRQTAGNERGRWWDENSMCWKVSENCQSVKNVVKQVQSLSSCLLYFLF